MHSDEPISGSRSSIHRFVADLVPALHPEARLVDLAEGDDRYTLRIDLPGQMGKPFTIPRRVVETASGDERALTILRFAIRTAVLTLHTQRTLQGAADVLGRKHAEPRCSACSQRIPPGDPVVFEHGETFHLACRR